jgi:wyosine [tRNA(Phe)-imidazoG37] synthetase (radical SAM superfamily)
MRYIYGPVKSRRLGLSLGISLTPHKICNFDCIYCQLGRTKELISARLEYARIDELISELRNWFTYNPEEAKILSYITLSGLGEPTLNIKIGDAIKEIKKITSLNIAVITNASLLNNIKVRQALLGADLILSSLDTVSPEVFVKLNRPATSVKIDDVISGLINLSREFKGKIWLEIMLLSRVNDDLRQIRKLKEVVQVINPDKIQLNSPLRTTAEPNVLPVDKNKLEKIKEILGEKCEVL